MDNVENALGEGFYGQTGPVFHSVRTRWMDYHPVGDAEENPYIAKDEFEMNPQMRKKGSRFLDQISKGRTERTLALGRKRHAGSPIYV